MERVVYATESVLDIRELNSWVYVDGNYRGSGVHILSIQDRHGEQFAPILEAKWSEVTEGIATRKASTLADTYSHELRVDAMCMPVRVLYRSWFQCVSPQGGTTDESDSRYWIRYVRP